MDVKLFDAIMQSRTTRWAAWSDETGTNRKSMRVCRYYNARNQHIAGMDGSSTLKRKRGDVN